MPDETYQCSCCSADRDWKHLYICDRSPECLNMALCWPCMGLHIACAHNANVEEYLH